MIRWEDEEKSNYGVEELREEFRERLYGKEKQMMLDRGPWIQSYTGKQLFLLDPREEDILIEEIAHALSMICRFTGHIRHHYCVSPDTRILTSRLLWKQAGDLVLGEGLIGFDEYPIKIFDNHRNKRKLRRSTVKHTEIIKRPVYALHLSDGTTLKSSIEHPWLVATKISRNQTWKTTTEIVNDLEEGRKRYMLKFLEPWKEDLLSYDSGYMAGILDGEGSISLRRDGTQLEVAQNPGPVLEKIKLLLDSTNTKFSELANATNSKVRTCQLKGHWHEKLRLLGIHQPVRLINKFEAFLEANDWTKELNSFDTVEIEEAEYLGEQNVVALETSTRTYFAEGFGAHNSVAQHSVGVSYLCSPENQLWGLLHDASEYVLNDVSNPLKRSGRMGDYCSIEKKWSAAICRKFKLPEGEPEEIKKADLIMLATEARDLYPTGRHPEFYLAYDALSTKIEWLDPHQAEKLFLDRFKELIGSHKRGQKRCIVCQGSGILADMTMEYATIPCWDCKGEGWKEAMIPIPGYIGE